jgi:hypothetical protein
MNKEFIPYEQALELKELGFDEKCLAKYAPQDETKGKMVLFGQGEWLSYFYINYYPIEDAPLYQQAFRWFREKHNLVSKVDVCANRYDSVYYDTTIIDCKKLIVCDNQDNGKYNTYEEAELSCLKKLIEIVKNKKQ